MARPKAKAKAKTQTKPATSSPVKAQTAPTQAVRNNAKTARTVGGVDERVTIDPGQTEDVPNWANAKKNLAVAGMLASGDLSESGSMRQPDPDPETETETETE